MLTIILEVPQHEKEEIRNDFRDYHSVSIVFKLVFICL